MNKTLKTPDEIDLGIDIHLTPKTGLPPKNSCSNCNHSTQISFPINVLWVVTKLHKGDLYEN